MAIIGTVREIKDNEYRVGLVPGGAKALAGDGHEVLVEKGAGLGSGISDEEYRAAGAAVLPSAGEVWSRATRAWPRCSTSTTCGAGAWPR